uniref:Uncharacterized protein n=1 Tax=Physcomitrium patens TaxID=3218 RepID=A0A7I4FS24_PHYPA
MCTLIGLDGLFLNFVVEVNLRLLLGHGRRVHEAEESAAPFQMA